MVTARNDDANADYGRLLNESNNIQDLRIRVEGIEKRWAEPSQRSVGNAQHAVLSRALESLDKGHQFRVATPAPLGLYSFGLTLALSQGGVLGWIEGGTEDWTIAVALAFGGLAQLLAGMWEVWRNNVFGGTVFSSYGAFWLGYAVYGILTAGNVLEPPANHHQGQMFIFLWGFLTAIFFVQTIAINIALAITFALLTATLFLGGVGADGRPTVAKISGYFGIVTSFMAWYVATAELTNSVYRRQLLPLGIVNKDNSEATEPSTDQLNTL